MRLAALKLPDVRGDRNSLLTADINGDGEIDHAFQGLQVNGDNKKVFVAVVYGPAETKAQVDILEFGVGGASESDLCALPAKLTTESLDYDPTEEVGGPVPGFERSKTTRGLNLAEGNCDSFHLFWDHQSHRLDWWRL
ncbi:MAG: hypothetical protein ACLQOO_09285 [Terriglobia bacterium]